MTSHSFLPGISALIGPRKHLLKGRRLGVVSHHAAVDSAGTASADLLYHAKGVHLTALLGPEHGYFGCLTAGEHARNERHQRWNIPLYSLYCEHRKPTRKMLKHIDTIIFDLQDLGARCYTYVSTLRLVLEAAAELGKSVIVADRPIPLPRVVDGPVLDAAFESFVAAIPAPIAYGMTPGETALWLKQELGLRVDLNVCKMQNYNRDPARGPDWPPWIPPSPGIASWESAQCYTATVFFEALHAVDHGRGGMLPFQVFGAPWIKSRQVCDCLADMRLPGVKFHSHHYYVAKSQNMSGKLLDGVRMTVINPNAFRPVTTAVCIISCLQRLYGRKRIWHATGTRPEFFDKLFGTDSVRKALLDSEPPDVITKRWKQGQSAFMKARGNCLLYAAD